MPTQSNNTSRRITPELESKVRTGCTWYKTLLNEKGIAIIDTAGDQYDLGRNYRARICPPSQKESTQINERIPQVNKLPTLQDGLVY